jgi:IS4 transposase
VRLSDAKILEVYALRWSIEVYFKEIKQNLGFLKEQSGRYQLAYASVHLAAMRHLLRFEAMLRSDQTVEGFLNDALHLSPDQVSVQLKAEQLGYL